MCERHLKVHDTMTSMYVLTPSKEIMYRLKSQQEMYKGKISIRSKYSACMRLTTSKPIYAKYMRELCICEKP